MSAPRFRLPSRRDPLRAEFCARLFGEYIQFFRSRDDRPWEKLARAAALTVEEWQAIEAGQLPLAWEQVLMLAMALNLGRSWMPYLKKLYIVAWCQPLIPEKG